VNRLPKVLKRSAIVIVILGVLLEGFTLVIRYPNPIAAVKLGLAPASKTPDLMPAHTIAPSTNPISLPTGSEAAPKTVTWQGSQVGWQEFLDKSYTNAFLILRNGVITYQYYRDGFTPTTRLPSYSVGKTMTSIMAGQLIAAGKLKESDTFVKYFPEFKTGGSFDKITVQQLLDMQSGVGVSDNYPSGPTGWGVAIAQMYASTDINWFLKHNRKMAFEPGSKAEYRSVDTQMLGMIIKKITGMRISDYFSKNVWQPVGALTPATWNVDRVGGTEKTFCCFNASAPDYAKVGLMLLNRGMVGDKRVIDANWVKRLETPVVKLDDWGYGAFMWHPFPGTSTMDGLHGQYVFIDPKTRTVIVKLSDVPTAEKLAVPTMAVFKEISDKQN
jgi:CubicO group peptidase (beta-lactamase class C family)